MGDTAKTGHPQQSWMMDLACALIAIMLVLFVAMAAGFVLWAMFQ
jgi:hypothetical protein